MIRSYDCKLVLEDGSEYRGYRFGAKADRLCEVVFNTSMVGYQEIVSDPSYTDQAVVMTYPIIGNYGVTDEDFETKIPTIGGLVVREYNDILLTCGVYPFHFFVSKKIVSVALYARYHGKALGNLRRRQALTCRRLFIPFAQTLRSLQIRVSVDFPLLIKN